MKMFPINKAVIASLAIIASVIVTLSVWVLSGNFHSPQYAGQQTREVKSLSSDRVAGLKAGRGLGYAKSAELNAWPGPLHVLELADELELTSGQKKAVEVIRAEMLVEAKELGDRLIEAEKILDTAFHATSVSPASVEWAALDAAMIEGKLRSVHLVAHLKTRPLLSAKQQSIYQAKRGYGNGHHGHAGH